ncbi:MAG: 23S rRNA (guanosine(2251)-2'-O)-methyltransferase RlmB, partial [Bacteroidia bacterium]|nr:23S rRNA (guanosine(2251)-2'-O)-methyltransferase RlmB [Bacteroidia bacterium]
AGAIHHMPICRVVNLPKTVRYLKESGVKIVAATEKSDNLYTDTALNSPLAIVVGSEEDGISAPILEIADERVKIPVLGKIESLNVSVAAALMIYEAVRQKNQR